MFGLVVENGGDGVNDVFEFVLGNGDGWKCWCQVEEVSVEGELLHCYLSFLFLNRHICLPAYVVEDLVGCGVVGFGGREDGLVVSSSEDEGVEALEIHGVLLYLL